MNSSSSLDSKKILTNHHESNRSASDISNNGNNHSANSDSGRWSTDSDEGVLISNPTSKTAANQDGSPAAANDLIKKKGQQSPDAKKPSYFKLNLMNSLKKNKEMIGLNKFKSATSAKSKSDQNLVENGLERQMSQSTKNEENVRNEDIFIYVPTIREKNNTKQCTSKTANKTSSRMFESSNRTNNFLNRFNSMNCGGLELNGKNLSVREQDELNKSQSNVSSNSSTSSQKSNKPQIVNVYPKRSNSIGELLSDHSQSKHSDEDEEIKKLYCARKQITKSSGALKPSEPAKLSQVSSYKANLQNSIDTLSTNNSLSEDNNEDYEELIASTLQQKRIKTENKTIWTNEDDSMLSVNSNQPVNLRGNKLYASFANGQLIGDKLRASSEYASQSLFRTGQYYSEANQRANKSTSNLSNCNLSNGSAQHDSQNALINGEFYLMKGRQSSVSSLTNHNARFESLPIEPSIYGKHLNTLSKEKFKRTPQTELDAIQSKPNSATLQHKKERNSTGKKIASQLQSYFFSGSISSKKKQLTNDHKDAPSKVTSNVKKQINDLNEKFPLPNAYKKNFILKGHLNVGLYSSKEPASNSLSAEPLNHKEEDESIRHVSSSTQANSPSIHELKTKSSKSFKSKKIDKNSIELVQSSCVNLGLNGLVSSHGLSSSVSDVHREIALAAKELGAWY